MLRPLIQCVPNFSEGRRPEVITALQDAMLRAGGVYLLDHTVDDTQNRTTFTLAGLPEEVEKAVWAGVEVANELINLDEHTGEHPRFGAADVIPFIPLRDVTMAECVDLAHRFGGRLAERLGIPVYFYESAALRPDRRDLTSIRRESFQYEQLRERIGSDPAWVPDAGPAQLGTAGACLVGARLPLVTLDVVLNSHQLSVAGAVAGAVDGLKGVRATAALIEGKACLTLHLADTAQTPVHRAMEMVRHEAAQYGVLIESSHLVGLIPQAALFESAAWYWQLRDFGPERVLEDRIAQVEAETPPLGKEEPPVPEDASSFITLPRSDEIYHLSGFADAVAQSSVTPGSGAVSALVGALGASLAEMVAGLTLGKRSYRDVEDKMRAITTAASTLRNGLLGAVHEDMDAITHLMQTIRAAKSDPQNGEAMIQAATLGAADVPLKVARLGYDVLQMAAQVVESGNRNAVIDAAVGAQMALAAVESAVLNLRANLNAITDEYLVIRYMDEGRHLVNEARALHPRIIEVACEKAGLSNGADF